MNASDNMKKIRNKIKNYNEDINKNIAFLESNIQSKKKVKNR